MNTEERNLIAAIKLAEAAAHVVRHQMVSGTGAAPYIIGLVREALELLETPDE